MSNPTRVTKIVLCVGLLLAVMARPAAVSRSTLAQVGQSALPVSEYEALAALYQATAGEQWRDHSNWLTEADPDTWYGVELFDGHVARLDLADNGLSGALPADLGDLARLEALDLSHNALSGNLPASLGSLTLNARPGQRAILSLADNDLSGAIPPELGLLTLSSDVESLLDLSGNRLSGALPPELGQLDLLGGGLSRLDLSDNQFSGSLPASLGQLHDLYALDLSYNALQGTLPTGLMAMRSLRRLDLGYNGLWAEDEALRAWITALDADWQQTQTVAPEGVRAMGLSPSSAIVFWTPPPYADSPGLYAVRSATQRDGPYLLRGFTRTKAESSVTISGLDPQRTHYFRVYTYTPANDRQQNALWSEGSWPIYDQDSVVWAQEAEDGQLTYPMQTWADEGALGGRYVSSPDNSTGQLTLIVELAERGYYTLWARSMGLDYDQNSFYLSIDGAPATHYELPALDGRWDWRWRRVYRVAESDAPMPLLAGTHYVTFRAREIGTRLDRLMVARHPMQDPDPATPWPTLPAPTLWPTATATPVATHTPAPKADIWLPLLLR